jgi:biopolymer transport protein ExbD
VDATAISVIVDFGVLRAAHHSQRCLKELAAVPWVDIVLVLLGFVAFSTFPFGV